MPRPRPPHRRSLPRPDGGASPSTSRTHTASGLTCSFEGISCEGREGGGTGGRGPIDLIRLRGEGNSVVLRLGGRQHPQGLGAAGARAGEFLVETPFVRGSLRTWVFPDDLRHWQEAMDALDAGQDIAWREGTRGPEVFIERDAEVERAHANK
ncbi:DUF5959 family protein, partial [Streptomyces sp. NPDC001982]|uniref:DUF5959 family protein n=1 Tax=Streptomyces sp. NPDC001982 TaxID=3154405 RepID=UPI00331B853B